MRTPIGRASRGHRQLLTVLAVFVVVACGAGTAVALSSSASSQPAPASPTVDPAAASQLSVFDSAQTSADALPAPFGAQLQNGYADAAPSVADSRQVTADDGQTAYLVPDQGGACVVNTNEAFCTPSARLPGAAVVDLCSPSLPLGQLELEWLLPDGATNVALGMSNDATTRFAPGYNVYIARLPLNSSSPLPTTIEWDDSGGQHHSVNTPIPPGTQSQSCMHPPGQVLSPAAPSDPTATTVTGPATPINP
jgi:hypothetical protein